MTAAADPLSDGDDAPIGRILTRRETLALVGAAGLAAACAPAALSAASPTAQAATGTSAPTAAATSGGAAVAAPSCIVRPALTEGPYFVDEKLNRRDIRSDTKTGAVQAGIPLALTFSVTRVAASGCAALQSAQVDVWHCNALGVYSDVSDPSFNSKGTNFLRGYQVTDSSGIAVFTTIYPGWYQGRAVHIHFKIRTPAAGGTADFTSQLFFADAVNAEVFAQAPYSQKSGSWLRNSGDGIYTGGGDKLLLNPTKTPTGYTATFDIGIA
jgi:protocatechuate 3,4-dioxygenase beta subunit